MQEAAGAGSEEARNLTHLTDVLAERRVGDHLAQEVQVRRHQRHHTTAVEHGQVLLVGQSHLLRNQDQRRPGGPIAIRALQ